MADDSLGDLLKGRLRCGADLRKRFCQVAVEGDECRENRDRAVSDGESAPGMEDEGDPVPNQGIPRTLPFLQ